MRSRLRAGRPLMSQPDGHTDLATLLRAASEGDQEAWNAITNRFTSLLWSVARSYRLGSDDAEALPGWLATTARREALGILRRRGRTVLTRDEDLGVDLADPASTELDSALLEDERDVELWASFAKLPERCQQLLRVLMACDRPVYAEVSAAFDMPIGSIGPTRMRCLERLRKLVAESGYQFDGPMDRPREARS